MAKLEKVILAIDDLTQEEIIHFLSQASPYLSRVKIGLEIFYLYGKDFVKKMAEDFELRIFLDLKLHDIPQTVSRAIRSVQGLPVEFLTLHLSGGRSMITAGVESAAKYLPGTKILGVTHLTSLGTEDFKEIWDYTPDKTIEGFTRLIRLGHECHVHGLVLSAQELPLIHSPLIKICPGIRFEQDEPGDHKDQKRVATPRQAIEHGADYLVIGRSLTKSAEWKERLEELQRMFA